jgi:hypothetical protein
MDDRLGVLYKQFNPMRPLTADDKSDRALYVDWQAELVGREDAVKYRLARSIVGSANQASTHLFTGAQGAGKTTELHRVKHLLREGGLGKRFFVSMLMAEESLDLADLQAEDLSFQIVRQLVTDLRKWGYRPSKTVRDFFQNLADQFRRIGLDVIEVGVEGVRFTFRSRDIPRNQQRAFRELLQGEISSIYDLINNELIAEARQWLAAERRCDDILVIVDELDKIPLQGSNHEELFLSRAGHLRALDCPVLYTLPIELLYSYHQNALRYTYGTDIKTLPIMPVADQAGRTDPKAAQALSEIVERRANAASFELDRLFESDELLAEVLAASGGHVRTLLVLIRSMLDRIGDLPITRKVVNLSLSGTAADIARPLTQEDWQILEEVHRTKQPISGGQRPAWNQLLRDSYVLTYYDTHNGYWYDRNPLLRYVDSRRRRDL